MIEQQKPAASSGAKPPVVLLLAIWGQEYIDGFFGLGARTLLAPGNLPALAEEYDCEFLFLTKGTDIPFFDQHPLVAHLRKFCKVGFLDIHDLIFDGNYSTTITLAYLRGMQSRGEAMTSTYFIYLVSDYIMADGSMRGLMDYMRQGYSGITAGNFQVTEEETCDDFRAMIDPQTGVLAVPPRKLLAYAMRHMHPVTLSNIVNQNLVHNVHSNRLFWRIDANTMLGRFYLRHMICIKPETRDFQIGASCDYSFIAELCPSGNVSTIDDSDKYCVVELQPLKHEIKYIGYGPYDIETLAQSLSEWTTAEHRRNVFMPTYYHSADLPPNTEQVTKESLGFVEAVSRSLVKTPQPVRKHPYWVGAIDAARQFIESRHQTFSDAHLLSNEVLCAPMRKHRLRWLQALYHFIFGDAPDVRFPHHRWRDYAPAVSYLRKNYMHGGSMLIIADHMHTFTSWLLKKRPENTSFQHAHRLIKRSHEQLFKNTSQADYCCIFIQYVESINSLPEIMDRVMPLMKQDSEIFLFFEHDPDSFALRGLQQSVAYQAACLFRPQITIVKAHFTTGVVLRYATRILGDCFHSIHSQPNWFRMMGVVLLTVPVYACVLIDNIVKFFTKDRDHGYATSGYIILKVHHHE